MALEDFQHRDKSVRRAIQSGEASPTIAFAVGKGGEILDALKKAIRRMDTDQRKKLARGVTLVRKAIDGELDGVEEFDNQWHRIVAPVAGLSLGAVIEFLIGIPYAAAGGGVTGLVVQKYLSSLTNRRRRVLELRLAQCDRLLADVSEV